MRGTAAVGAAAAALAILPKTSWHGKETGDPV
jgi:hypothetical protein